MKAPATDSATRLSITMVFLGCGIVLLTRSYLFYEGSESFIFPAEYGFEAPMYDKPLRWARVLLHAPLLMLRHVTDNLETLSVAYGLPFALIPALSVLVVLHCFRAQSQAASVALIGMCLAPLPWQLFSVSPWAVINQLSWVLVACVACARESRALRAAIPLIAVVLFFTHALSVVGFLSVGVGMLLLAYNRPEERVSRKTAGAFLLLGALRLALVFLAGSEKRRFGDLLGISQNELTDGFQHPGAIFVGFYLLLLLASAMVFMTRRPRRYWVGASVQAVAAMGLLGYFAVNPRPWLLGVDYHLWTFAVLPPLIVACLLCVRSSAVHGFVPATGGIALTRFIPALLFLTVLTAGSVDFRREMSSMRTAVDSAPNGCVEVTDLPRKFSGYPAFGFVFSNNYLATGAVRQPAKVLLARPCQEVCWRPSRDEHHLFDFGVLSNDDASHECATTMRDVLE